MSKEHDFQLTVRWTGNMGSGTSNYRSYNRSHVIHVSGKPDISGSSDPAFRGDANMHNPEDLLLASLSSCHMLWYLHLCADAGVVVTRYEDQATGTMVEISPGGRFTEVMLHPRVTVADQSMCEKAMALHNDAHKYCFIANSVNFPVLHQPVCNVEQ